MRDTALKRTVCKQRTGIGFVVPDGPAYIIRLSWPFLCQLIGDGVTCPMAFSTFYRVSVGIRGLSCIISALPTWHGGRANVHVSPPGSLGHIT
jgi:hypothetical protein